MMSPEENADLQELKSKTVELKVRCFDYMKSLSRMTPEELPHTGYKSIEAAFVGAFKSYMKDIDKLLAAYLKKYPDER